MKLKTLITSLLLVTATVVAAQTYDNTNTEAITAHVLYHMEQDGFFYRSENRDLFRVSGKPYAYDKALRQLYVIAERANCTVTLTKDAAKEVKRNKAIPQLKGEALTAERDRQTALLDTQFKEYNDRRTQHLADSVAKARADSIAKARADSIAREERLAAERKRLADYKNSHNKYCLPTGGIALVCRNDDCPITFKEDSVKVFAIKADASYTGENPAAHADSLCFMTYKEGFLGVPEGTIHSVTIPAELRASEAFQLHCQAFADSLFLRGDEYADAVEDLRYYSFSLYVDKVVKEAPYGFVKDWEWGNEYGTVTLDLTFLNTNAKTVRYIDVYFRITNDVGDTRATGHFRGTGPVEQYGFGRWDWDESSSINYCFYGDASKMSITKIILTYNGGSKRTLTGNQLHFDWDHDE